MRIKDQVPSPDITGRRNFLQGHTLPKLKSINSVQTLNVSHKTFTASSRTVLDGVFKPWMSKLQLEAPLFLILKLPFLIFLRIKDQVSSQDCQLTFEQHCGWTWFIQLVVCSRGPCLESISLSHGYRPTLKKVYPEPYTYPHHISEVLWIDVSPMEGMFYWPELMQEHWYHLQL